MREDQDFLKRKVSYLSVESKYVQTGIIFVVYKSQSSDVDVSLLLSKHDFGEHT